MSNHLAIATVTQALGGLLGGIKDVVRGAKANYDRPDKAKPNEAGVGVYLYEVRRHAQLHGADLPTRRADGSVIQRPVLPLTLRYLISFYGSETLHEPQRLMGAVMAMLHEQPVLTPEHIRAVIKAAVASDAKHPLVDTDLDQQAELVRLTPMSLSVDDMSKLWSVFFQTAYALSVVYEASLVLLDGKIVPQPALPVHEPVVSVTSEIGPVIDAIEAEAGGPITASDTLVVHGRGLAAAGTRLRFSDVDAAPTSAGASRLTLLLTGAGLQLRAGVHGLRIVRQRDGSASLTAASNVAPFVLHPTISVPIDAPATATAIHLDVSPPVRERQALALLLNGAQSYRIAGTSPSVSSTRVSFDITGVASGTYLVRLEVDGVQSVLVHDAQGYRGPEVVVP